MVTELKYKRVLLKISGEALMGNQGFGIDPVVVNEVAQQIKAVHALGAEIAVVVGGGLCRNARYSNEWFCFTSYVEKSRHSL